MPNEPVNILMVDDKRGNLVALEAILSCPEYNLVSATSGDEALKHVLAMDFACILLDVMMPDMDGFEVARLVRQRGRSQTTPIIFLTAIAKDVRFQHQGYAVGAVDYLQKPLDPDIVKAKVSVFVELFLKNKQIQKQERLLREAQRREQEFHLAELKHSSEQHYRELAESLLQTIWTTDVSRNLTFLSNRWYDYTGTEIRLYPIWDDISSSIDPRDRKECEDKWLQHKEFPAAFEVECRVFNKESQSYRWNLCRAVPEKDNKGSVVGWVGTFTDIHAQKRAEEGQRLLVEASAALNASFDYRSCLMNSANIAARSFTDIFIVDLLDDPQTVTHSVFYKDQLAGSTLLQMIESDAKTMSASSPFVTFAASSKAITLIEDVKDSEIFNFLTDQDDPQYQPISLISTPIVVQGRFLGVATLMRAGGIAFDEADKQICEELSRQANLAIANSLAHEEVRRANKAKDEFLALLSHELRTPLNAMIGWAQFLKLNNHDPSTVQGLEVIERNGQTLGQLVSDLLDVSRIVTGKLQIERAPLEMQQFVSACIEGVRPLAEAKMLRLSCYTSQEQSMILGDADRLQQVFTNLLMNAIKFTPEGGKIEVYVNSFSDSVVVMIRDSGQGIRQEFLSQIFDRFSQADSTTTRKHAGLGLGLAIVRHLTELHGGNVSVESDGPGRGATFTVVLPKAHGATSSVTSPPSKMKTSVNLSGASVFVVDDDQTSRDIVVAFLKRSGASVRSAGSVREAMAGIKQFRPQVVISDIGMPEEDGYDLLRKLKSLQQEMGIPIRAAALTAYASAEDALKALDAGFDAHFSKPFKFDELLGAIAKLAQASDSVNICENELSNGG